MNKMLAVLLLAIVVPCQALPSNADKKVFRHGFPAPALESSSEVLSGLRKLERASALAKTGAAVLYAISPDFYECDSRVGDGSVNFIKQLSGTINKLAAYALLEQSSVMRFTRVLEAVAENRSWHTAPAWADAKEFEKFTSEFSVAFARSLSMEIACYVQGQAIGAVLGENPNRLVERAAYVVATTITVGLLQIAFNKLDEYVNGKKSTSSILRIFGEQFYRELAFHVAGELIRRGVEDIGRTDCLADLHADANVA